MFDHIDTHGMLFIGAMALIFVATLILAVINGIPVLKGEWEFERAYRKIHYVRDLGLLALVVGILGQLDVLYGAFQAIIQAGDITPGLVFEALKASLVTTIFGFVIYIISFIIWVGLSWRLK